MFRVTFPRKVLFWRACCILFFFLRGVHSDSTVTSKWALGALILHYIDFCAKCGAGRHRSIFRFCRFSYCIFYICNHLQRIF